MGFLQRSRSAAPPTQKSSKKRPDTATQRGTEAAISNEVTRSDSHERPQTGDQRKSFSRPRMAHAALERRTTEPQSPSYRIDFKAGTEIFSFPTPSLLPSKSAVEPTPTSSILIHELPAIGVAIGSPGYKSPWGRSCFGEAALNRMPTPPSPTYLPHTIPSRPDFEMPLEIRKKKSAWKAFGDLFGRRGTKPKVVESATADIVLDLPPTRSRPPIAVQTDGWSPMFRSLHKVDDQGLDDIRNDSPMELEDTSTQLRTMHLNLDLPDPVFDRYSVMFEKQLVDDSRPSLLERRKSKLQRTPSIKMLNLAPHLPKQELTNHLDAYALPHRSATSPGPTRSLSRRIGHRVLTPVRERFSAMHRRPPQPIQRSKTAPPSTSSPAHPTFSRPSIAVHTPSSSPHAVLAAGATLPTSPLYPPPPPPPLTPLTSTTFQSFTTLSSTSSFMHILDGRETETERCGRDDDEAITTVLDETSGQRNRDKASSERNHDHALCRPHTSPPAPHYHLAKQVRLSCATATATAAQVRRSVILTPAAVARPRVVVLSRDREGERRSTAVVLVEAGGEE